jgi:hypothetical protein
MTTAEMDMWGTGELNDLVTALQAGLERVEWAMNMPGSVTVTGAAWASEEDEQEGGSVARRGLYEVAEQAVATVDALGWEHAEQPAVEISPAHPQRNGWRGRYLLRVTFRLRPQ